MFKTIKKFFKNLTSGQHVQQTSAPITFPYYEPRIYTTLQNETEYRFVYSVLNSGPAVIDNMIIDYNTRLKIQDGFRRSREQVLLKKSLEARQAELTKQGAFNNGPLAPHEQFMAGYILMDEFWNRFSGKK